MGSPCLTDLSIIAHLYPARCGADDPATQAILRPENKSRLVLYRADNTGDDYHDKNGGDCNRTSPNAPPGRSEGQGCGGPGHVASLQFKFDEERKNYEGYVLGSGSGCDVILPDLPDIESRHCVLGFDTPGRLILRDLPSFDPPGKVKTAVLFDNRPVACHHDRTWILAGPKSTNRKTTVIAVGEKLKFELVLSPQLTHGSFSDNSEHYKALVERFRNCCCCPPTAIATAAAAAAAATAATTNDASANQPGLIRLPEHNLVLAPPPSSRVKTHEATASVPPTKNFCGYSFAVIRRVWDSATGEEFALVEPANQTFDLALWKREAAVLEKIKHRHIVELIESDVSSASPPPRLLLESVPMTLAEQHMLKTYTWKECFEILHQGLSVLSHLHAFDPPVIHGNIRPQSITVDSRDFVGNIHLKFCIFRPPDATTAATSAIGNDDSEADRYLAPELWEWHDDREMPQLSGAFSPAGDLWSLGVVMYEYSYPRSRGEGRGRARCQSIVDKVKQQGPDNLSVFLAEGMLVMDPRERWPTQSCSDLAPLNYIKKTKRRRTAGTDSAAGSGRLQNDVSAADDVSDDEDDDDFAEYSVYQKSAPPRRPVATQFTSTPEPSLPDPTTASNPLPRARSSTSSTNSTSSMVRHPPIPAVPPVGSHVTAQSIELQKRKFSVQETSSEEARPSKCARSRERNGDAVEEAEKAGTALCMDSSCPPYALSHD